MITLALLIAIALGLTVAIIVFAAIFALPVLDVAVAIIVIWGLARIILAFRNRKKNQEE